MNQVTACILSILIVLVTGCGGNVTWDWDDAGGTLSGVHGVTVGFKKYDVDFIDGSCESLFSGCNGSSDFMFQSLAKAEKASNALVDLLTDKELRPSESWRRLVSARGCDAKEYCMLCTPYALDKANPELVHRVCLRLAVEGGVYEGVQPTMSILSGSSPIDKDTTIIPYETYVLWKHR